jgi:hypothetical protein
MPQSKQLSAERRRAVHLKPCRRREVKTRGPGEHSDQRACVPPPRHGTSLCERSVISEKETPATHGSSCDFISLRLYIPDHALCHHN